MRTIKEIQQRLNVLGFGPLTVDGISGPKTKESIKRFKSSKGLADNSEYDDITNNSLFPPSDPISIQRLDKLHPKLREEAKVILSECEAALTGRGKIRITQGLRTIDEQNELYAQGRTKPGKVVTNARGGSSYHNYGVAVDFVLVVDNKLAWDIKSDWDNDKVSDWMEVVHIFQQHGWEWGGNWKSLKDYPHFQKTFGYNISDLRIKWNKGDIFIQDNIKYINL